MKEISKQEKWMEAKAWFPNKNPNYTGFYKNELKDGDWKYYFDNGKVKEEGPYKDSKKQGHWISWTPYGFKDMEGDYINERPNGLWTYYYETGVKSMEQNFKDGKQDGKCSSWYENAQLKSTTSYSLVKDPKGVRVESKPDGKWTYYDKNGKIIMETTYKKGVKIN